MDQDQAFQVDPDPYTDPIRIQGFDDQKVRKKLQQNFFYQKLQFNYVQTTGEAFSP